MNEATYEYLKAQCDRYKQITGVAQFGNEIQKLEGAAVLNRVLRLYDAYLNGQQQKQSPIDGVKQVVLEFIAKLEQEAENINISCTFEVKDE